MRSRPTLILLILAAIAAGYFFLYEQPRSKRQSADETEAERLATFDPAVVRHVLIVRPDMTIEFEGYGDVWHLMRPVKDVAEASQVNVLVYSIVNADVDRRFEANKLDEFGLATPDATVQLADSTDAAFFTIEIGNLNMTREFAYARLAGHDDVLLVPAGIRRYALRDLFQLRSKVVAGFDIDSVERVGVTGPGGTFAWKRADGRWTTVAGGDTLRGDGELITDLLKRLRAMRARALVDEPAAVSSPAGIVDLSLSSGDVRYTFSHPESAQCYVASSAVSRIARVDAGILDVFSQGVEDFRDRHVVSLDPDSVARVELRTATENMAIVKSGPEWTFPNAAFGNIDQAAISVMFRELGGLRYRDILSERLKDRDQWGLAPAPYELSFYDADGRLLDRLEASEMQNVGRVRYATSHSSGQLGTVDTEPLDELAGLLRDLRDG